MHQEKNNSLNLLITGALLGSLATFLFATKTGRKLKDELIEEGIRIFDILAQEAQEAPEQIKEAKKELGERLQEKVQQITSTSEQVTDTAQQILREVPEQAENLEKKTHHLFFKKRRSSGS